MTNSNDSSTSTNTPATAQRTRTTIIQQTYDSKMYSCEITWTIPNFEAYHQTTLYSKPFSPDNHNYEWILKLHIPQQKDKNEYVELHLSSAGKCVEKLGHTSGNVLAGLVNSQGEKNCIHNATFNTTRDTSVAQMKLVKLDNLQKDSSESLLSQGALKIYCQISFVILNDGSRQQSQDFEKYFKNQESSDLTVNVDGKIYPAHKFVLAAHSPVFEAMFAHDMKENQQSHIDIKDVDEKVFVELLRYMYIGKVENLQSIALDLAIVADKYNIEKLKSLCEWKIGDAVTAETAVKLLISSELYNLHDVKKQTFQYINSNLKEIIDSERWNDLHNHPKLLTDFIKTLHKTETNLQDKINQLYDEMWNR